MLGDTTNIRLDLVLTFYVAFDWTWFSHSTSRSVK